MLFAKDLLAQTQRLLQERQRPLVLIHVQVEQGQVVQAVGVAGMLLAENLLVQPQRLPLWCDGFSCLALAVQGHRSSIQPCRTRPRCPLLGAHPRPQACIDQCLPPIDALPMLLPVQPRHHRCDFASDTDRRPPVIACFLQPRQRLEEKYDPNIPLAADPALQPQRSQAQLPRLVLPACLFCLLHLLPKTVALAQQTHLRCRQPRRRRSRLARRCTSEQHHHHDHPPEPPLHWRPPSQDNVYGLRYW
jgi:hypothetical protein